MIPARIRERLGIEPGDEIDFVEEGEAELRLRRVERRSLRGAAGRSGIDPLRILEEEHRREVEQDRA